MGLVGTSWRRASNNAIFALAFLALLVNVAAPPGYMLSDDASAPPFTVVLCTAQGPIAFTQDQGQAPAHKPRSDVPCAFAGHGVGAAPPMDVALAADAVALYRAVVSRRPVDLAPGRGLAAPPPPPRGPPLLL